MTSLLLGAAACGALGSELRQVVALDVAVPDSGLLELGDTLRPTARALDGNGDSVTATVVWATLDTAILTVDSATGLATGKAVGIGRLQAHVGALRSNPIAITVRPPLDSIAAAGTLRDTVVLSAPDSLSDSLRVQVYAPTATIGSAAALVRREVVFTLTIYPAAAATVTLVPRDTVRTTTAGLAVVQVRFGGGQVLDSVVVSAGAVHADGTPVAGSPTFVVEFRQ